MYPQYTPPPAALSTPAGLSALMLQQLLVFLTPFLLVLDDVLDTRLVRTVPRLIVAILRFRDRPNALLLSELGAFILSPAQAPAGTKRLSNLLRSPNWQVSVVERFLWQRADTHLATLEAQAAPALVLWDGSHLEKPESRQAAGLCPVRSSKAARLRRHHPGFSAPPQPGPPIVVPGLHWLGILLAGPSGPPTVAALRWWTTRGEQATSLRTVEEELLRECVQRWGRRVVQVYDRGFAGQPGLEVQRDLNTRFIGRWPKRYLLADPTGQQRPTWQWTRGKRVWDSRAYWDVRQRRWIRVGVGAREVRHPVYPDWPLWLVLARRQGCKEPWYLLTNEPCPDAASAWAVVEAYVRRWQIEQTWRYCKSGLGFESPRLWSWERRLKLLALASLAYAFLLSLLEERWAEVRQALLRQWCHRTGSRSRTTAAPLYRLRAAISALWAEERPPPLEWERPAARAAPWCEVLSGGRSQLLLVLHPNPG